MARRSPGSPSSGSNGARLSSSVDDLLAAALERGDDSLQTGRYVITFKEGAVEEGIQALGARGQGMRVADARDYEGQAATLEDIGDADAVMFPEIGVAVVSGEAVEARGLMAQAEADADSPIESIDPEYFVFADAVTAEYAGSFTPAAEPTPGEYLRGFLRAAETIARDLQNGSALLEPEEEVLVAGATWGLIACRVPPSGRNGTGIKVAVLDTGFDLGHPEFAGRPIVSQSFVGQPVQDGHGHGTHTMGTACGPQAPAGNIQRYGIGYRASMFVGKVLTNSGSGTQQQVLAGMNWAIANRCPVISMSLGSQTGVQPSYTAAGLAALNNGCLIIAAAGNAAAPTGAPANSPTIMSVASLDPNLTPSSFSDFGKIEIAAPGRDVFSSWPRPVLHKIISGTSMATPHVSGCAALWAQTSPNLRARLLWQRLQATARRLPPLPPSRVGAGLVQAPP